MTAHPVLILISKCQSFYGSYSRESLSDYQGHKSQYSLLVPQEHNCYRSTYVCKTQCYSCTVSIHNTMFSPVYFKFDALQQAEPFDLSRWSTKALVWLVTPLKLHPTLERSLHNPPSCPLSLVAFVT